MTAFEKNEMDLLLIRANDFAKIGENYDCLKTYAEITNKYPGDYRGWFGLVANSISEIWVAGYSEALDFFKVLDKFERTCKCISEEQKHIICEKLNKNILPSRGSMSLSEWKFFEKYSITSRNAYEQGLSFIEKYSTYKHVPLFEMALLDACCVKSVAWRLRNTMMSYNDIKDMAAGLDTSSDEVCLPCVIGDYFIWKCNDPIYIGEAYGNFVRYDKDSVIITRIDDFLSGYEYWKTIIERENNGLCLLCGGKLTFFSGTCKSCKARNSSI